MDSYRGHFDDHGDGFPPVGIDDDLFESPEDPIARQAPPPPVGQDERRMQVRAYNFWASLLDNRNFPAIEDFRPEDVPELAPYAVVLDFGDGIDNPGVSYLGEKLGEECASEPPIRRLADIPSRSLLSRITDHYLQILANEAPIGFEAEFVNMLGRNVVYRGILLPFSSDGDRISHIVGVINWKELADQATTDALLAEIDRSLAEPAPLPLAQPAWADGPVDLDATTEDDGDVLDLAAFGDLPFPDLALPDAPLPEVGLPAPEFGEPHPPVVDATSADDAAEPRDLAGWLASARALAAEAQGAEDRTRSALYAAIGRAWDFALAALAAPEEFAALVAGAGLAVQARAPLTPIVKLVFGADYDKTRLTEYATALAHAQRLGIARGEFARHLAAAPGGIKGVVQEERRLKRGAAAKQVATTAPRESLARKLRRLPARPLESFAGHGGEFAVLLARRLDTGEVVLLGEAEDAALLDRAVKRVLR
ncbi:MAG: hypothetical protein KGM17_06380 [Sphingomonadales bacterium]|nr:hypothetical protein [Sphingomonadales bacterium]